MLLGVAGTLHPIPARSRTNLARLAMQHASERQGENVAKNGEKVHAEPGQELVHDGGTSSAWLIPKPLLVAVCQKSCHSRHCASRDVAWRADLCRKCLSFCKWRRHGERGRTANPLPCSKKAPASAGAITAPTFEKNHGAPHFGSPVCVTYSQMKFFASSISPHCRRSIWRISDRPIVGRVRIAGPGATRGRARYCCLCGAIQ